MIKQVCKFRYYHIKDKKAVNSKPNLQPFNVPCENRTHNWGLGGSCYIHLTKGTNTLQGIIDKSLHPDGTLKTAADLRFTIQVLFVDTDVKLQIVTV